MSVNILDPRMWRFWKPIHDPSVYEVPPDATLTHEIQSHREWVISGIYSDILNNRNKTRYRKKSDKEIVSGATAEKPAGTVEKGLGEVVVLEAARSQPTQAQGIRESKAA